MADQGQDDWVQGADDWADPDAGASLATPSTSVEGSLARGAVRGTAPAFGGLAGAIAAAGAAQPIIAPIAAATGPAAPLTEGALSLAAGIGGAYGGGSLTQKAQDWILDKVPSVRKFLGQDEEQQKADVSQHPYASLTGELAPNLLLLRPGRLVGQVPKGAGIVRKTLASPTGSRVAGATVMGTMEAAQEKHDTGTVDPAKVGIAATAGAFMNKPTRLGEGVINAADAPRRVLTNIAQGKPANAPPPGANDWQQEGQTTDGSYTVGGQGEAQGTATSKAVVPSQAPGVGDIVGIRSKSGPPRRATVDHYFDNGNAVRLRMDDGTVQDLTTADMLRTKTEAPEAAYESPAPVNTQQLQPDERPTGPLNLDDWVGGQEPAPRRPPATAPLGGDMLNALDHADSLERAALNQSLNLSGGARQDMLTEAARLRRLYGRSDDESTPPNAYRRSPPTKVGALPIGQEGDYAHPMSGEPAADLGELAKARNDRPDLYSGEYQRPPGEPPVDPYALEDIQRARAPMPKGESIFDAIRKMGGIKPDPGGDIRQITKDFKNPPFVKRLVNPDGMPADDVRRALQEEGWFGRFEDQFGANAQETGKYPGDDIRDLYDLIDREARGEKVYHPESSTHADLAERAYADREMTEAGVTDSDSDEAAAHKLAAYRATRGTAIEADHGQSSHDDFSGLPTEDQERLADYGYEPGADVGAEHEEPESAGAGAEGPEDWLEEPGDNAQDEGGVGDRGEAPAEDDTGEESGRRPGVEEPEDLFATEPGAVDAQGRALDQTIIPGAEKSAKALAAAREATGHGKIKAKSEQKAPGGLFGEEAPPEPSQRSLFQPNTQFDAPFDFTNPGGPGRDGMHGRDTKIGDTTITYGVPKDGPIEVSLIKTKPSARGNGSARKAMEALVKQADAAGRALALTPEPMEKGVGKGRLRQFYQSLGFKPNTGRGKDFSTRAAMIRKPKSAMFQPGPMAFPSRAGEFKDLGQEFSDWVQRGKYPNDGIGLSNAVREYLINRGAATDHEALGLHNTAKNAITHMETSGLPGQVNYSDDIVRAFRDPSSNLIVHHNHPSSRSFSKSDIASLAYPGVRWMIVHGHDGNWFGAELSPAWRKGIESAKSHATTDIYTRRLVNTWEHVGGTVEPYFIDAVKNGQLTVPEVNDAWPHAVNTLLANHGIIDYRTSKEFAPHVQSVIDKAIRAVSRNAYRQPDPILYDQGIARILGQEPGRSASADAGRGEEGARLSGQKPKVDQPEDRFPVNPGEAADRRDNAADDMAETLRTSAPGTYSRTLHRMAPPSGDLIFKDPNAVQNFTIRPETLARLDTRSATKWNAEKAKEAEANSMVDDLRSRIANTMLKLPDTSRDKVYAARELDRINGLVRSDTGHAVVARNDGADFAHFSKPGQVVTLNQEETDAYHALSDMFDRAWKNIMEGAARKVGWTGPWDKEDMDANLRALNHVAETSVDDKGLARTAQRAAQIVGNLDAQRRQGYHPLMRFGDYFAHVTPKIGTDMESTGGFPKTVWFELAERRLGDELVGGSRKGNQSPEYAESMLERLQEKFPADKFNVEHGFLAKNPDMLDRVDIPAIEKLMTFMENDMLHGLRVEARGRGMSKGDANEYATKKYDDLYGRLVDHLWEKAFQELQAGYRKKASTVPGYCIAPETKLLTADMRWVRADSVNLGDELVGFEERQAEPKGGRRRKMKLTIVERVERLRKPTYRIRLRSGRTIIASDNHLFLYIRRTKRTVTKWKSVEDIQVGDTLKTFPYEQARSDFDGGWMSGILDGEGWMTQRTAGKTAIRVGWAQLPGLVSDRAAEIVRECGFKTYCSEHALKSGRAINTETTNGWSAMQILQTFRPIRLLESRKWIDGPLPNAPMEDDVIEKEFLGSREVIGIKTTTHTFIAEGICSHNSSDFDRALGTYMHWTSRNVADQIHRPAIDEADSAMQTDPRVNSDVKRYWKAWTDYQRSPSNVFNKSVNGLARWGFLTAMGVNPSSTAVVGTHGLFMAGPTLSVGLGMKKAAPAYAKAMNHAMGAVKVGRDGLSIPDATAAGRTPGEKAFLQRLDSEGILHSRAIEDMAALNEKQSSLWGSARSKARKFMDIALSNVSVMDRANRIASALSAYRLAGDPATLAKMDQAWRVNQIWRDQAEKHGVNQESMASFMVPNMVGEYGKANQAPIERNAVTRMMLGMHGFVTRLLSKMWQMGSMSPEGRQGLLWVMGAFWLMAGLDGEPFAEDVQNGADLIWKTATGKDPMLGYRIQAGLASMFGKAGASLLLHGPASALSGADVASRLGMGDLITRNWPTAENTLGAYPSIILGRVRAAVQDIHRGEYGQAATEALPAGVRNAAKAVIEREKGVRTGAGKVTVPASRLTPSDTAARALGFTPEKAEEAYERQDYRYRASHAKMRPPPNPIPPPGYAKGGRVEAETHPSDAQIAAGNYKKGHLKLHGLDISIETPKGVARRGVGADGKEWENTHPTSHYGYIRRTEGADGESVDCYVGPHESDRIFIVDQFDPKTRRWDEHKLVFGARTIKEAKTTYDHGFSDGSGPRRRRHVHQVSPEELKAWLSSSETERPFAEAVAA